MKDYYKIFKQGRVKEGTVFPNLDLISYHIPKTAGTSMYTSLEKAYGVKQIQREYEVDGSKTLSRGEPYWVRPRVKVIHGHFRPHYNHNVQFPNAKKIIWVRDPIERCWSLLRHWVKMRQGKYFNIFKDKYMKDENWTLIDLFNNLVLDKEFEGIINVYQTFSKNIERRDIDFIGKSEDLNNELIRLSGLIGRELKPFSENVNPKNKELPFVKKDFYQYFEKDYEFLDKWIGITYEL